MSESQRNQHSLCWLDLGGRLIPEWTVLPNICIIKSIALQYLSPDLPDLDVRFFSEGPFNKVLKILSPHNSKQCLMRVTLPVEPFLKTESEVATLTYVRRYTSIPVPKVIAYDTSSKNELGFECVLLEKTEGFPCLKSGIGSLSIPSSSW